MNGSEQKASGKKSKGQNVTNIVDTMIRKYHRSGGVGKVK